MQLVKYKACICEGSAEEAIMDIVGFVERLEKMRTNYPRR